MAKLHSASSRSTAAHPSAPTPALLPASPGWGGADGHLLKVTRWLSTSYNLTSKNPNYPFRATSLCFRFVNADADVSLFTQMDLKCSRTILKITPRHWALHLHTVMYFPTHPFSYSSPFRSRRKLQHQDLLSVGTFLSEVLLQTTAE